MRQNLVFLFLIPFIIYLSGFDLFSLSNFPKILLDIFNILDSLVILSYIKWYNLCVIKCTAIFMKHIYCCFVSEGLRLSCSKFLPQWSITKQISRWSIFKKGSYIVFWFYLKQILCSECKQTLCSECKVVTDFLFQLHRTTRMFSLTYPKYLQNSFSLYHFWQTVTNTLWRRYESSQWQLLLKSWAKSLKNTCSKNLLLVQMQTIS